MSIKNHPAFPLDPRSCADAEAYAVAGLTKHEHFVLEMAKAHRIASVGSSSTQVARAATQDADVLIAELEKQG